MLDNGLPHLKEFKMLWEEQLKSSFDKDNAIKHAVAASQFQSELFFLAYATEDDRFVQAGLAIHDHGLVDSRGSWRRDRPRSRFDRKCHAEAIALAIVVGLLKKGISLRYACGVAATLVMWEANSFEAATKSIERLWRSTSVTKAEKNRPGNIYRKLYRNRQSGDYIITLLSVLYRNPRYETDGQNEALEQVKNFISEAQESDDALALMLDDFPVGELIPYLASKYPV
jgi:hypothetical protein